jgi:hypothetical protein
MEHFSQSAFQSCMYARVAPHTEQTSQFFCQVCPSLRVAGQPTQRQPFHSCDPNIHLILTSYFLPIESGSS